MLRQVGRQPNTVSIISDPQSANEPKTTLWFGLQMTCSLGIGMFIGIKVSAIRGSFSFIRKTVLVKISYGDGSDVMGVCYSSSL